MARRIAAAVTVYLSVYCCGLQEQRLNFCEMPSVGQSGQAGRLQATPVAVLDRPDRSGDRPLQEPQPGARDHLGVPIALALVVELLSLVGIRVGHRKFAARLWLRREERK